MLPITEAKKIAGMRAIVKAKKVAIDLLERAVDNKDHVAEVRALDKQLDTVIDLISEAPTREKSNRGRKPGKVAKKTGRK